LTRSIARLALDLRVRACPRCRSCRLRRWDHHAPRTSDPL